MRMNKIDKRYHDPELIRKRDIPASAACLFFVCHKSDFIKPLDHNIRPGISKICHLRKFCERDIIRDIHKFYKGRHVRIDKIFSGFLAAKYSKLVPFFAFINPAVFAVFCYLDDIDRLEKI